MQFEMPMATAALNNAVAYANVDEDGESSDIIGAPLDQGVDHTLVDYDGKIELNLAPKPGAKREEIWGLHWGKIEKDAARLEGLGAAVENISSVIKKGKDQLAHEWKGESFDAFRASVEKVEAVLNEYAKAAKTTAQGFRDAMTGAKSLYSSYRDNSLGILKFDGMSPPNDWWKFSDNDAEFMASHCTSHGGWEIAWGGVGNANCTYNDSEQKGAIVGKFVNRKRYDQLEKWDCTNNPGVSLSQYRDIATWSQQERQAISDKVHEWYVATDRLKDDVKQVHTAALDNLQVIAERKVFSSMQTPAAPAGNPNDGGGGHGGDDGHHGGGGGGGPYTGGGGGGGGMPNTGGGGGTETPPNTQPDPHQQPDPNQHDPLQQGTDPQGHETVTIEDGDHKISVDSPDGQGHVKVTVDDGTGKPKSYDLDFGSGTQPSGQDPAHTLPHPDPTGQPGSATPGQAGPGGTHDPGTGQQPGDPTTPVHAGQDGKCVINDPPLTITAERPPGSPDQVVVTIDDGTGKPTTYTLDYEDGAKATPVAQPFRDGDARMPIAADDRGFGPSGAVPDASARMPVAADGQGFGPSGAVPDASAGMPVAADPGFGPGGAVDPDARPSPYTGAPPADAAGPDPSPAPLNVDPPVQGTAAQSSLQDGPGLGDGGGGQAMLGGLPDDGGYASQSTQAGGGEAGLAAAQDDGSGQHQAGGMGGGMPMMGGMGAGSGGDDYDRAGSAWRTTGDLFDEDESFAPFGGVLESDDPGARR